MDRADDEDRKGNAAVANGLVIKANRHYRVADSIRRKKEVEVQMISENELLWEVVDAARDLYERVEMDESVGICLSDRVPSLRLRDALARTESLDHLQERRERD